MQTIKTPLIKTQKINKCVAIYGYNYHIFEWKKIFDKNVYQTTGMIIGTKKKKYIITIRSHLIDCKTIIMYHNNFQQSESIMKNDLEVLFQCIEQNIIILGTKGYNELNLSKSKIICGNDNYPNPKNTQLNLINCSYIIPTTKSKYYTIKIDTEIISETIKYQADLINLRFIRSIIDNTSYLPDEYMYEFLSDTKILDLSYNFIGINGSFVFNMSHKPIGIITKSDKNKFYVLPIKSLVKIYSEYLNNNIKPNEYDGLLSFPLIYTIQKKDLLIVQNCNIRTTDGIFAVQKDDVIISINENNCIIINDYVMIFDKDYNDLVPLNTFLKYNLVKNKIMTIKLVRDKKIIELQSYGISNIGYDLPLTDRPFYLTDNYISHVVIKSVVFVKLSHELIYLMKLYNIQLTNFIIDNYPENFENGINMTNIIIIIDCFDNKLSKKYNLPTIQLDNIIRTIKCPIVTSINHTIISNLNDILLQIKKNDMTKNLILTLGHSYETQNEIII